jgi:ParB family chromosome partitioning protein
MRSLTAQKTVALQMTLAGSVPVALAALAYTLVQPLILDDAYGRRDLGLDISAKAQFSALSAAGGAEIEAARAWQELRARVAAWAERLPRENDPLFAALLALPQADLLELLGLCAALSVNAIQGFAGHCAADTLAQACGLDMAQWWKPTAATYFNAVSKARILSVLAGAELPVSLKVAEAMKKGELVSFAEQKMVDSGWLPEPLRQQAPVAE